jgi:hypothetical protein
MANPFVGFGRWLADLPLAVGSTLWAGIGGLLGLWLTVVTSGGVKWWWGALSGFYVALLVRNHTTETRLHELEQVLHTDDSPAVVFDRARHSVEVTPSDVSERIRVSPLWFLNQPVKRTTNSVARGLMARIEFCDSNWQLTKEIIGQWAVTRMPEHVGWQEMRAKIDLAPGLEWGKRLLTAKPTLESFTGTGGEWVRQRPLFALAGENIFHQRTADHPEYFLGSETTRVRVILSAENMGEQLFQFQIDRSDDGGITAIRKI